MAPYISVVVPAYNRLPLLRRAVRSVLAQTFRDFELVVVDDGSTDGTADYIASLPDPRVRLVSIGHHTGRPSIVRNAGASEASGRWLCFLDSDDLWLPDKLAVQVAETERAGVHWSYVRYDHIDERGTVVPWRAGQWRALSGYISHELVSNVAATALPSTGMVDRALFDAVGGFDPSLQYHEDQDLSIRLSLLAPTLAIDRLLVLVCDHDARATALARGPRLFRDGGRVYERAARAVRRPDTRLAARRQAAWYFSEAAGRHLAAGQPVVALRCLMRAALLGDRLRHMASAVLRGIGLKR